MLWFFNQDQGRPIATVGLDDQIPIRDVSGVREPPTPHRAFAARVKKWAGGIEQSAFVWTIPSLRHAHGVRCHGEILGRNPPAHCIKKSADSTQSRMCRLLPSNCFGAVIRRVLSEEMGSIRLTCVWRRFKDTKIEFEQGLLEDEGVHEKPNSALDGGYSVMVARGEEAAGPLDRRLKAPSGDDQTAGARGVGVGGYGLVRQGSQTAHDGIFAYAAEIFEFAQADVGELGMAVTRGRTIRRHDFCRRDRLR